MSVVRMSFCYSQEMKDELSKLAKKDARSLSSYVQMIFKEHLEKKGCFSEEPTENKPKKKKRKKKAKNNQ